MLHRLPISSTWTGVRASVKEWSRVDGERGKPVRSNLSAANTEAKPYSAHEVKPFEQASTAGVKQASDSVRSWIVQPGWTVSLRYAEGLAAATAFSGRRNPSATLSEPFRFAT